MSPRLVSFKKEKVVLDRKLGDRQSRLRGKIALARSQVATAQRKLDELTADLQALDDAHE